MVRPPPGVSSGSACRPWPRSARGTAPGRGPTPVVLSVSPSRWNGTNIRLAVVVRDAGPAVDDPQLDPVAERAARSAAAARRRGVAQRVGDQVGDDALQDAGSTSTSGRSAGISTATVWPAGPRSSSAAGDDLVEVGRPREDRQRAGLQPAHVEQVLDQPGEPVERLVGRGEQLGVVLRRSKCTSSERRLVTAALAEASGVRRSWLTAASSAVRIRSASAIGLAASAGRGQPLLLERGGRVGGERAEHPAVGGGQRAGRARPGTASSVDRHVDVGVVRPALGPPSAASRRRRCQSGRGPGSPSASASRSSSVTDVHAEGLADPVERAPAAAARRAGCCRRSVTSRSASALAAPPAWSAGPRRPRWQLTDDGHDDRRPPSASALFGSAIVNV